MAQSASEILAKCRATVENITSYEYIATSSSEGKSSSRFFFARQGESYRYDQRVQHPRLAIEEDLMPNEVFGGNAPDVKAGFDGLYYFETNLENRPERVCTEPKCVANMDEPFLSCFSWLTKTNSRSELLKKSRWDDFAGSCVVLESGQQIEGMLCTVVTSGLQIDGARFEIAFGVDLGHFPVRVRRLVGNDRLPIAESVRTEFKHFRIDNASFFFPCRFVTRSLGKTLPFERVIKVQPGTLRINSTISSELVQLSYDPADFNR